MSRLKKYLPSANSLLVFEAAARAGNFRLAAEELRMTQPNVSHAIKAMEAHLGIQLFNRGNRGVNLTKEGAELYSNINPALQQIEQSLAAICSHNSNTISVAASTSVSAQWLLPMVAEYQRANPAIKVNIVTTDRNIEPGGEVDFSIRRAPLDQQRDNSWFIVDEVLFPICSTQYLQSAPTLERLTDLAEQQIIHNREPHRRRMGWQEWLQHFDEGQLDLPESLVVNDYQLVLQACMASEGVALGWSFTSSKLIQQGVLVRPLPHELATGYGFYMMANEQATLAPQKQLFVEWICDKFRQNQTL